MVFKGFANRIAYIPVFGFYVGNENYLLNKYKLQSNTPPLYARDVV